MSLPAPVAGSESKVIVCKCGRLGVGARDSLKHFGWSAVSTLARDAVTAVTWFCPKCAGRSEQIGTTQRCTRQPRAA
jgi:hypothetical protein